MKGSIKVVSIILAAVVVTTMLIDGANGRGVNVGGRLGWNPGVNYTQWASNETVYVGDWIIFRFPKYQYDVVEVNETGYEKCDNNFMIANITRGGGKDVYECKEAKTYYFICTKGPCWSGMKVAINVTMPPPPAPSPQGNGASIVNTDISTLVLLLAMLLALLANA